LRILGGEAVYHANAVTLTLGVGACLAGKFSGKFPTNQREAVYSMRAS
jgi:hypothetical protein